MTEGLTDRISSIPPLPKTFIEINNIYNSPNGTISDISRVVEEDPMLVANILKIVNSPLYNLRAEIKSVSQAVSLLGMKEIKALSAVISAKKLLKVDMEPYGIEPEHFAHLSNMQGALAKIWFKNINLQKEDILFMAALLQETGKIIIADEIIKNDESYQFKSEIDLSVDISQVEKSFVDISSAEVTAKIFKHWGFDDFTVNIIHYSNDYQNAPQEYKEYALYLKIIRISISINSPLSDRNIAIATNILQKENKNTEAFLNAIDIIKDKYKGTY